MGACRFCQLEHGEGPCASAEADQARLAAEEETLDRLWREPGRKPIVAGDLVRLDKKVEPVFRRAYEFDPGRIWLVTEAIKITPARRLLVIHGIGGARPSQVRRVRMRKKDREALVEKLRAEASP